MGSDCHSSCLAGVKDRFGKTNLETSDSKCGLSQAHVLCGFTLRLHRIMVKSTERNSTNHSVKNWRIWYWHFLDSHACPETYNSIRWRYTLKISGANAFTK
jgi:hypothetical protein